MSMVNSRPWIDKYPEGTTLDLNIPEEGLYSLLEHSASTYGERTAIIFEDKRISYQQLKAKTDCLASAWAKMGAEKGERIGLMVSNHPLYIISYYAAQKLGMVVVQLNPMYTKRELLEVFYDAELAYIVVEKEQIKKSLDVNYPFKQIFVTDSVYDLGVDSHVHVLDKLIESSIPSEEKCRISVKTDIAVIQYTGGTTGKKKGAMLTHYNLLANVLQSKALYGSRMGFGEETVLAATPLYHVYAMTVAMNLGIYIGATIVLVKKFEMELILEIIRRHKPTFFPGVPKMYNAFVNYPNIEMYGLNCLKICSSGSAPLPVEVIRKFEKLTSATIGEGYGLSETSPSTHRNPPDGVRKIGSIGIPLPGTDCKIIDDLGDELPEKGVGELLLKGPQIMLGYYNKPEETAQTLKDGWLLTGDLATMDEDGYFYIVGRKKEMIIVGGFNVYPQEVEEVLYQHPDVQEAAVVGLPDEEIGEKVKAFIVPMEGKTIDIEGIKDFCYQHLTRYKVPKQIEFRNSLPRNTVGKLLKRILIEEELKKN